jgi:hypothetical protein
MSVLGAIGWAVIFAVIGGLAGFVMVLVASFLLPHIVNRLTPDVDEEKEILRGNVAVGEYFGRVVAAGIIGISIVVAAAVAAGLICALHG